MGNATRNIIASSGPKQNRKYSIIIPAAGEGVRMKRYGPKPLIKIDKDNIIERQFKIINSIFRWYEIILVTGFQHEKVNKFVPSRIKTVYNENFSSTNVIHSINIGLQECTTDNIIIIYGDLIFNKFALNVAFNDESAAVIANTMTPNEIGCNIDNGYIEQMFYEIPNKWAQILFLKNKELDMMRHFASKDINANKYGFEAVNHIISNNGHIQSIKPKKAKVIDIDTSTDLKRISQII